MIEWRKVKLGDICSIKSGKRLPKGADFSSCPTENKYIRARDIKNGVINGEDLAFISNEVKERISKYIVNTNDVIVTIAGTIGEVAFVTSQYDGVNLTENAIRLTNFDHEVNSKYVFYTLRSNDYYEHMQKIAGGAAQPKMGIYKVEAISIALPSIDTQERIVDILSRYDALIENYQRQIKLLEEAAQRLFKEWFVDLRFPGHQSTPIINNLPQSWQKKSVNDVLTFHRGYDLTKDSFKNGKYPVVGSTSILGYHCNYKIDGPGIVTGRSGSLGVYQLIWENFWPHNTSLYVSDFKGHDIFFIYCLLNTLDFTTLDSGGAIPSLNRNTLSNIQVLEPSMDLQDAFSRIVKPMFVKQRNLSRQIRNLSEARDRLLPKLMSGEASMP